MQEKLQEIFSQHYRKRDALIPILQDIQGAFSYLPPEAMTAAARFCRMDPVEVYGVATFYAQFRFSPMGKNLVMVCQGTACYVRGGKRVLESVVKQTGCSVGETSEDRRRRPQLHPGAPPFLADGRGKERVEETRLSEVALRGRLERVDRGAEDETRGLVRRGGTDRGGGEEEEARGERPEGPGNSQASG